MFTRIFSRGHKQTTFSDAGCLGILRVKDKYGKEIKENPLYLYKGTGLSQTDLTFGYHVCLSLL